MRLAGRRHARGPGPRPRRLVRPRRDRPPFRRAGRSARADRAQPVRAVGPAVPAGTRVDAERSRSRARTLSSRAGFGRHSRPYGIDFSACSPMMVRKAASGALEDVRHVWSERESIEGGQLDRTTVVQRLDREVSAEDDEQHRAGRLMLIENRSDPRERSGRSSGRARAPTSTMRDRSPPPSPRRAAARAWPRSETSAVRWHRAHRTKRALIYRHRAHQCRSPARSAPTGPARSSAFAPRPRSRRPRPRRRRRPLPGRPPGSLRARRRRRRPWSSEPSAEIDIRTQCSQQKISPSRDSPWPMTLQPQSAQVGARGMDGAFETDRTRTSHPLSVTVKLSS